MIEELISNPDRVEVVRDKVALLLAEESAAQMVLAGAQSERFRLNVYTERANPWEQLKEGPFSPIVNVSLERCDFHTESSSVGRQATTAILHVDVWGFAVSEDTVEGHLPGDEAAAFEAQRAVRLVRGILLSGHYQYLGLPEIVSARWVRSVQYMQPPFESKGSVDVVGARLELEVSFNELSVEEPSQILEAIAVVVVRGQDGRVLCEAEYAPS